MASGNMGGLYASLDIKSKIDEKLKSYKESLDIFAKQVEKTQGKINTLSAEMDKLEKGSNAWNKQKETLSGYFRQIDELIGKIGVYEKALGRVQRISDRVGNGGLLGPARQITSLQDTKPIEELITKYEKALQVYKEMVQVRQNLQTAVSMGARNKNESVLGVDYAREKQHLAELEASFASLSNGHSFQKIKGELESLYAVLNQWSTANDRAKNAIASEREEEQRRAKNQKDARIGFEQLVAAMAREEAQERANKTNIEATNKARQQQIKVLREQAQALMQNRIAALQGQRAQLASLYSQGKRSGLDSAELENIIARYKELSRELLNLRSMMQNAKGLSYNEMFGMGRNVGPGRGYVGEAAKSVANLRQYTQEAATAANQLASAFNRVHNAASRSSQVLSDIKSLFLQGGIVFGAQQFANSIIKTGGDIVQQHIALRSILGDVQKADTLFSQTQQLALQSPFTFQELNRDVKQLAAFGVDTDRLYDTTKRLADVASGLGVSFERLGLAYGQVKARSWLDGKELRQFAYAGLPMLQKIADLYNETGKNGRRNYTTGDVRNMITKRMVSFEDVDKVFQRLTDEGGQFYNLQFVLSETLLGRWNKLQDAWSIMLGKFADGSSIVGQVFMTAINGATEFILQLDKISPLLMSIGAVLGGKTIFGALTTRMGIGLASLTQQMALAERSALKTYATRQMQDVMEGKITAQLAQQNILKQRQLLSSASVRNLTYAQLAAEGKMSVMQMGQLAYKGQIMSETIAELQAMGAINDKQAWLLQQLRMEGIMRKNNVGTMLQLGATTTWGKISGFFTPGNIAMAGAMVGMSLWLGYKQWSDRVKAETETLKKSLSQTSQRYSDFLKNLGSKGSGGLDKQVESMKEVLETSNAYTDTIKAQVEGAKDLSEQYDILKKAIDDAARTSSSMNNYAGMIENAYAATGLNSDFIFDLFGADTPRWLQWINGLGNDDIKTNTEEATTSLQKFQLQIDSLDEKTRKSMEKFIQHLAENNKDLAEGIKGLSFSEQIRTLSIMGGDDWESFVDRFAKGSGEVENWFDDLAGKAKAATKDIGVIMYEDVPAMLASMRKELDMSQVQFQQWAARNPQLFASMMDEIAAKAGMTSKDILRQFHSMISQLMNLNFWPDAVGDNGSHVYRSGLSGVPILAIRRALDRNGTMVIGKNYGEYDKKLRTVQHETWEETAQEIQKQYKTARNEYDQIQSYIKNLGTRPAGVDVLSQRETLRYNLQQWENIANAAGVTLDVGKNKTTGNYGKGGSNGRDEQLKAWQKEARAIQSYYDAWDKWRKVEGDAAARGRVAHDDRFSEAFRSKYSDPEALAKNYEALADSVAHTTEERRQFVQEMKAKAVEKEADIEYEKAQRLNNIFKEQLDWLSKRYEIYEKLVGVAGRENAGMIAFGTRQHSDSYYKYLQDRVGALDFKDGKGNYYSLQDVLAMPDEEALSKFGMEKQHLVKELKQERDRLDSDIADSLQKGYEYFEDYEAQIEGINKKYDEQIERLKERNKLNKEDRDYVSDGGLRTQTSVLGQQRSREIAATNYKSLQRSDTWIRFFSASILLGSRRAREFGEIIKGELTELFKQGGMTAEEYASKIEEVNEKMREAGNRHSELFDYIFGGGVDNSINRRRQDLEAAQEKNKGLIDKYTKSRDEALANGDSSGAEGYQNRINELIDKNDEIGAQMQGLDNMQTTLSTIDAIIHKINEFAQGLKKLVDDIAQTKEIFQGEDSAEAFRTSKGYALVSGWSASSQGATDAWDSLKSGNGMGVIEGVYRSFSGTFEAWAQRHNAKQERLIKLAERQIKVIQVLQQSLERTLENTLGGAYGFKSDKDDLDKIKEGLDNYSLAKTGARYGHNTVATTTAMGVGAGAAAGFITGAGSALLMGAALGSAAGPIGAAIGAVVGGIVGALFGHKKKKYKTNYTDDTYESMQRAYETQEYYDLMYASYKMQRDNLNAQLKAEEKKKGSDKDKINDYKEQLDELDDTIANFAKDMAKSLYEIDVKSWAKELTEAIVSAWAAGEDAVDAYKEKVKDLMKTLATNIVTQKIMEVALQPVEDYIESVMKAQSGKLDEDNVIAIANLLDSIGDSTIPAITDLLDRLKEKGWDLSDTDSASMSSSIKGITETTADILAAYLNAIRADVSVIRQLDGIYLPKLDVTATAQLQQLGMIARNTLRNADAAEEIRNSVLEVVTIMNATLNDTRRINVIAH